MVCAHGSPASDWLVSASSADPGFDALPRAATPCAEPRREVARRSDNAPFRRIQGPWKGSRVATDLERARVNHCIGGRGNPDASPISGGSGHGAECGISSVARHGSNGRVGTAGSVVRPRASTHAGPGDCSTHRSTADHGHSASRFGPRAHIGHTGNNVHRPSFRQLHNIPTPRRRLRRNHQFAHVHESGWRGRCASCATRSSGAPG